MSKYPGGYSRWPALRKTDTCDAHVRLGPDPEPFRGTMNIAICRKPAVKLVLSAGMYIGLCADCLKRLDPTQYKTKDQFNASQP